MYNGKNDNDNNNFNSLIAFAIISIYWQCIIVKMIMIIIKYITN